MPRHPEIIVRLAAIATSIAVGGTTIIVALINQLASFGMARKSVEYSKELEEKKKHLSAELEHEKMLLDICKSDTVRRLPV